MIYTFNCCCDFILDSRLINLSARVKFLTKIIDAAFLLCGQCDSGFEDVFELSSVSEVTKLNTTVVVE